MKKVLILGSLGMAGHMIEKYFRLLGKYQIFTVDRHSEDKVSRVIDVSDFNLLHEYIERLKPDVVINCIGILLKESNENVVNAIIINSLLPQKLKIWGDKFGYKLIHLSTDCVFSGKKGEYSEKAFRDGDDFYARTKALGEILSDKHLTIRTSIIGPEIKSDGSGLLDWFLKQEKSISGYANVYWTGVTTLELAKIIHEMMEQTITGIYHVTAGNKISKYDLLKLVSEVFDKNMLIEKDCSYHSDKSLLNTRNDFTYYSIDYKIMLQELKKWMINHKELYSHYHVFI